MGVGEILMRWLARLALLAAAGSFVVPPRRAWRWWVAGWLLLLAHIAAAFHVRHHWSHAEAARHVAERTLAEAGVASSAGIWLNYLLVLLWTADVLGWLPLRWRTAWLSFWWFMTVNAAIVFERGPTRWAGIAVVIAVMAWRRKQFW